MDDETKKAVAVFRFGIIADLVGRKLNRGEKEKLLREKTCCQWDIPRSERSYISRSTIISWLYAYEKSGRRLESLYPKDRSDKGTARAIDDETVGALLALRKEYPVLSLPMFMQEARRRGILHERPRIRYGAVYRLFKRYGVPTEHAPLDRRRFEAELPNDLWQSDCLHGPKVVVEGTLKKSYLFAFIDDMSRLVPHAEFYLHERLPSYLDAVRKALSKRGLPRKLYVDNGPAFRSQLLHHACASLGISLIHSKPYEPQGRGKIERWFLTVRMQFLSTIPDGLTVDDLNERLHVWIDTYHRTIHGTTKQRPLDRYLASVHLIREASKDLEEYFRIRVIRRVDKDRTVSLLGRLYEAPVHLIGKIVTLLYHEHDPSRVEAFFNNTSCGMLVPLDVNVNCRIRRHRMLELLPDEKDPTRYEGGKLFGKGESHE